MRILIAHDSMAVSGGVESYLAAILPELQSRGHDVSVVYHRRRRETSGATWFDAAHRSIGVDESAVDDVMRTVRKWRPDVCFSHNMRPLAIDRALLAEWPVVKMMHGYFGTCASGLKMHAFPQSQACARALGAACLAMYVPRHCGQLHPKALVTGYRWAIAQRNLLPRYRAIAVASRHMASEYARNGVPAARLNVLPLFPTIDASEQRADGGAVLFVGRMTALKGGDVLVDAVAEASRRLRRSIPLVMAGDGPQRDEWARHAAVRDVAVEFSGWVEHTRLVSIFLRAGVVVIPILWPEPFGLVGLEAGAMGLPAIAFDVGGIREWLRPGENGLLVPPSAGAPGLAQAIVTMLSASSVRGQMARGARAVAAEMSRGRHADRLEQVLESARR
jgi:glycosyltransferase involved in cell wall biosynthesis